MKLISFILFVAVFSTSLAAVTPKKAVPKKGARAKKSAARSTKGKSSARPGTTTAGRSRQAVPSPGRYKEIQEALLQKGYLKSEANGVWDARSSEALKQYQTDNKLSPTGRLSSASLISLGLGPKTTAEPLPPSPAQSPEARP
jgi:hypothetical protein